MTQVATEHAPEPVRIDVHLRDGALASFAEDVRSGLGSDPKAIPPKYFYDARGSELFEQITALPEYYPARIEQSILDTAGAAIIAQVQPAEIVELGPGSARKTDALLRPMIESGCGSRYVPVDVSETSVEQCARRLAQQYERLEIHGLVGDFEHHLDRIPPASGRRLIAFLGGTIGNLDEPERRRLLGALETQLGPGDRLLVGTDLVKDRARLEAAYNDTAGVTAEFNRNLVHVINANLRADLDPDGFEHVAFYNERERRIEMWLRAREEMRARIDALGMDVGFAEGDQFRTEISCKFTRETLEREYRTVGLRTLAWYTDPDELFALSLTGPES
ncbi:MAG: L-histidine N(alpha)-methyltransferase [Solirubrobacterales bacterium]